MTSHIVSSLLAVIKRIQRAHLRRIMRGYRVLKQSGRLNRLSDVQQELTENKLGLANKYFSPIVMGRSAESGEIAVRQYLLTRIAGVKLNHALLRALSKKQGRVLFPMPKQWRTILSQNGFKVAHFRSALLWQLYIYGNLFYGFVKIGKIAFAGITDRKITGINHKTFVYFSDLGLNNLPQEINGRQSYDVVSWYLQWGGRKQGIESIHHNITSCPNVTVNGITVIPQRGALPEIMGWKAITRYVVWGILASIIATLDCLRGRWWHALMLNQAAFAAQVRNSPANSLAREYLFHNSGWIYRPLWTYETEQRGSDTVLYFYSTNCETFKKGDDYPPISFGYKAMSWSRYLVWDKYQSDFVKRAVGDQAKISVTGMIWFQSSEVEMPIINKRGVGVFDVTPHRASRYCALGDINDFYIPKVANCFLEQISNVISKHELLMLWKRKRNIRSLEHPQYRNQINQLTKLDHVVLIDSNISAIRMIESCVVVISMPFTSTALIGREMGKPSIYYDPSGMLQRDDRAAHGIPIILGVEELEAWFLTQFS